MHIDVVSMSMAEEFNPKVPTLAIRIFSTPNFRQATRHELDHRDKFTHVLEYTFNDLGYLDLIDDKFMRYHKRSGGIIFTPRIAEAILTDFEKYSPRSEALMVHCHAGISRSPAVAMALNEIFELGQEMELERDYINSRNTFVYDTIIRTRNGGIANNLS